MTDGLFDVAMLKIGQICQQFLPRQLHQAMRCRRAAIAGVNRTRSGRAGPGRDTVHHTVGRDVFRHHRARCQHRTITKSDGGQHNHAVTDPDIISSHHPIGAAGSQEVLFAPRVAMVLLRAGGKAML